MERTLLSVVNQNLKPARWIIVDDGSSDGTSDILECYAAKYPFIRVTRINHAAARQPGTGVIRAFNHGLALLEETAFSFIVKLDCDLEFASDYFEKILGRFKNEENLGIASGVYREVCSDGSWRTVKMPLYHAAGACKIIRKECFDQIRGFVCERGWDTIDEIRAMSRGWKTCHFPDLTMMHLKPEGSGIGTIKTSILHGEVYYRTGGGPLFFFFKVLHRIFQRPLGFGACALAWGYLKSVFTRRDLLVTPREAAVYNNLLRQRLLHRNKLAQS